MILTDAIVMKISDGQVGNRPTNVAFGIDLDGHRDVLDMWVGPTGGEGTKQGMNMLTELKNRGVHDVKFVCCDGPKGLPGSIQATWLMATVQTCVVHLVRNSLRFASRKYWKPIADHLKKSYQAPIVKAAAQRFDEFAKKSEPIYPATIAIWRRPLSEFTPFLDYPLEIRKLLCTTNGIESLSTPSGKRPGAADTSRTRKPL